MSQVSDSWKQFAESYQTMSPAEQLEARAKLSPDQQHYLDQVLETLNPTVAAVAAAATSGFETLTSDAMTSAETETSQDVAPTGSPQPGKGLRCMDFEAKQLQKPGFFMQGTYTELDQVLDRLNAWVDEADVEVVNIETVVLPNLYSEKEMGTQDVSIRTSGEVMSTWNQFFRVWYRA